MGIGKILGFAALGVGAIAAAPFTGGGSIVGAVSLAGSLAGAGALAAGAGVVGAGVGMALSEEDKKKKRKEDEKLAEWKLKAAKYDQAYQNTLNQFKGDKEYFNYIIGATALGIAIANADGEISNEEKVEIEEYLGGIASSNYPTYIKEIIKNLYISKPNFNTAMTYLERINPSNYANIRNLLELIMLADGIRHKNEEVFLKAFDIQISMTEYKPENNDTQSSFLLEARSKF